MSIIGLDCLRPHRGLHRQQDRQQRRPGLRARHRPRHRRGRGGRVSADLLHRPALFELVQHREHDRSHRRRHHRVGDLPRPCSGDEDPSSRLRPAPAAAISRSRTRWIFRPFGESVVGKASSVTIRRGSLKRANCPRQAASMAASCTAAPGCARTNATGTPGRLAEGRRPPERRPRPVIPAETSRSPPD